MNKFKVNQYNWLGQKLFVQHRFDDMLELGKRRCSPGSRLTVSERQLLFDDHDRDDDDGDAFRSKSAHLNYLAGLAKLKTNADLSGTIVALQGMQYQKNVQYLLLLCQCLFYLGNHDSVVALCKQVFNQEIDLLAASSASCDEQLDEQAIDAPINSQANDHWHLTRQSSGSIDDSSAEFEKILAAIARNRLINDSRLWLTFAMSSELQLQLRDADLAYRLAIKLATGSSRPGQDASRRVDATGAAAATNLVASNLTEICDYNLAHLKFADFAVRHRSNQKLAIKALSQLVPVDGSGPVNHQASPQLALLISCQANSNSSAHFKRAHELLGRLDAHFVANRNPSSEYNQLAWTCRIKLAAALAGASDFELALCQFNDEPRRNLGLALARSHIVLNSVIQSSHRLSNMYACPKVLYCDENSGTQTSITPANTQAPLDQRNQLNVVDRLIEALKQCHSSCWSSSAELWNNLGVCFLVKRKFLASLTCLMKANQMDPLNWRINFNLAIAHSHVGLSQRALFSTLAAKNFLHHGQVARNRVAQQPTGELTTATTADGCGGSSNQLVSTLLAVCCTELQATNEARRLFAELVARTRRRQQPGVQRPMGRDHRGRGHHQHPLVWLLINYLLFLHKQITLGESDSAQSDPRLDESDRQMHCKLMLSLLDLLEQVWLQRDQHDSQFSQELLEIASKIGDSLNRSSRFLSTRKTYAWAKGG